MNVIKKILKDLELIPIKNENEYVSESDIYCFILKVIGCDSEIEKPNDYYTLLAAAAISAQLIRQDEYGVPSFDEERIHNLLLDRNDDDYNQVFEYIFGKQTNLEHHHINKIDLFLGKNLKIEYRLVLNIFAKIITADLNLTLEKVKKKLLYKVSIKEWNDLIIGGNDDYLEIEIERMKSIVNGVLR